MPKNNKKRGESVAFSFISEYAQIWLCVTTWMAHIFEHMVIVSRIFFPFVACWMWQHFKKLFCFSLVSPYLERKRWHSRSVSRSTDIGVTELQERRRRCVAFAPTFVVWLNVDGWMDTRFGNPRFCCDILFSVFIPLTALSFSVNGLVSVSPALTRLF